MDNQQIKEQIESLLRSTNREGIENLIDYMNTEGFFTSPASTKFHGCYEGGLARHSLNVYFALQETLAVCEIDVSCDSQIIAALLHDLCKMGAYLGSAAPYTYNDKQPVGHALLSIQRIQQFIPTSSLEDGLIEFHMGVYGTREFSVTKGEFGLKRMTDVWAMYPAVKIMYFADELATLVEQAEERKK